MFDGYFVLATSHRLHGNRYTPFVKRLLKLEDFTFKGLFFRSHSIWGRQLPTEIRVQCRAVQSTFENCSGQCSAVQGSLWAVEVLGSFGQFFGYIFTFLLVKINKKI